MNYNFAEDLYSIREMLDLSQKELANKINVSEKTIANHELGTIEPSISVLEKVHSLAFDKDIKINKLKE